MNPDADPRQVDHPALADAVRNPDNPLHLMVLKPVKAMVRVHFADQLIAETSEALRVMEIGKSVYDPMVYVPEKDLKTVLDPVDRKTTCPLKGEARYLALGEEELGWTYETYDFAQALTGFVGFWPNKVRVTEGA